MRFDAGALVERDKDTSERACPKCGAEPGADCKGSAAFGSRPLAYFHAARRVGA